MFSDGFFLEEMFAFGFFEGDEEPAPNPLAHPFSGGLFFPPRRNDDDEAAFLLGLM